MQRLKLLSYLVCVFAEEISSGKLLLLGRINLSAVYKIIFVYQLPYFLGYKKDFSFQNNPKDLDPSYKTDLDLLGCLGRVKLVLWQNYIELIKLFIVILER